jgi:acetyltransferase-like isoleucine patch superfamily enzyme
MFFLRILNRLNKKLLLIYSNEKRIKYLRKLGIKIGKDCHINIISFSSEPYLVEIGDHVAIAHDTDFITHDGGIWCFRNELPDADIFGKIKIGNNVMIGAHTIILPNTMIGNNSIVGAGSVVRGTFPDNSLILGNPAKVVSSLSVIKFLYFKSHDLLMTKKLSSSDKAIIIKKHFNI